MSDRDEISCVLPAFDVSADHKKKRALVLARVTVAREEGGDVLPQDILDLHMAGVPLSEIDETLLIPIGTARWTVVSEWMSGRMGGKGGKRK